MQQPITAFPHQITGANLILSKPACGLYFVPGKGKTRTVLMALNRLKEYNCLTNTLIVCPKIVATTDTWQSEIKKCGFDLPVVSLIQNERGTDLSRAKRLEKYKTIPNYQSTIFIINDELFADLVDNTPTWYFPTVIIDEAHRFKAPVYKKQNKKENNVRGRALYSVRDKITKLVELTGTPMPNSLIDLYTLVKILDGGLRLGHTKKSFQDTFMYPDPYSKLPTGGFARWYPKEGAKEEVFRRISDICLTVDDDNDPSKLIEHDVEITLSNAEMKKYNELKKERLLEFENDVVTADNAAIAWLKLRQLANGTIYTENGYEILHTKKLEYAKYIVDNANDNVVIYYNYRSDLEELKKVFPDAVHLQNNTESKQVQDDWNAGKIRVLLVNPKSAGFGINIQFGGHTILWYTVTISASDYIQAVNRLYRTGQTHTVIVHRLITKNTVDEVAVYKGLNSKIADHNELIKALLREA